jgi:hypothetical protein
MHNHLKDEAHALFTQKGAAPWDWQGYYEKDYSYYVKLLSTHLWALNFTLPYYA